MSALLAAGRYTSALLVLEGLSIAAVCFCSVHCHALQKSAVRLSPHCSQQIKYHLMASAGPASRRVHWHRVIIDEAHIIKNHASKTAAAATLLEVTPSAGAGHSQSLSRPACVPASQRASFGTQADHRWLLSGTPVQNRPEELFSYLSFLQYAPYNSLAAFHTLMREPRVLAAGASAVERLRTVLRPIILRRTKQTVIDGRPILDLQPWCFPAGCVR